MIIWAFLSFLSGILKISFVFATYELDNTVNYLYNKSLIDKFKKLAFIDGIISIVCSIIIFYLA